MYAKTVLRSLGLLDYAAGVRGFVRTIRIPNTYDVEFHATVIHFQTARAYTKEWFHRNRRKGMHKGWHEPSITFLLEGLAHTNSVFIDVGAHLGYFSILFSSVPGNRSLAIELDPSNFAELKRAVAFQPAAVRERITTLHCGVSGAAGTIALPVRRALSPSRGMLQGDSRKGRLASVKTMTLDEIVRSQDVVPDIIKIDVEGSERDVLRGATSTLAVCKPVLIVEVHQEHPGSPGQGAAELTACFRERGYRMYRFEDHRSVKVSPLTEVGEISTASNHVVVCVHEDDLARHAVLTATGLVGESRRGSPLAAAAQAMPIDDGPGLL